MKYKDSILQTFLDRCYVCGSQYWLEIHHIFFGTANRKKSTEFGCVCALCPLHHRGDNGVHHNRELDKKIKSDCQLAFEKKIGSREYFIQQFGRSYV